MVYFFFCFFLILFFLLLKLTSFPLAEPAFPDSKQLAEIFHPALNGFQHSVLVHAYEKRLMSISENYLQDVQKDATSEEQCLCLEKFRQ